MDRNTMPSRQEDMRSDTEPLVREYKIKPRSERRQLVAVLVFLGILTVAGFLLWFALQPTPDNYVLASYTTAVVSREDLNDTVQASGTIAVQHQDTVVAPQRGLVETVWVEIGDWIDKGQLIVAVKSEELEDQVKDLEKTLQAAESQKASDEVRHTFAIRAFEREEPSLMRSIDRAERDYDQAEKLFAIGARSQAEVDEAFDNLESAKNNLEKHRSARDEAEILYALSTKSANADIDLYKTRLESLIRQVAETRVRSPIAGQVIDVNVQEGSWVGQYASLLTVADVKHPEVVISVPETQISKVNIGQNGVISVAGRIFTGIVKRIGATATADASNYAATVNVRLDFIEPPDGLAPGSSATVDILVGTKSDALVVPRGPFYTSGERSWIYVTDGNKAKKVRVVYGLVLAETVEILSGVDEGQTVITSGYQDFLSRTEIDLGKDRNGGR